MKLQIMDQIAFRPVLEYCLAVLAVRGSACSKNPCSVIPFKICLFQKSPLSPFQKKMRNFVPFRESVPGRQHCSLTQARV